MKFLMTAPVLRRNDRAHFFEVHYHVLNDVSLTIGVGGFVGVGHRETFHHTWGNDDNAGPQEIDRDSRSP